MTGWLRPPKMEMNNSCGRSCAGLSSPEILVTTIRSLYPMKTGGFLPGATSSKVMSTRVVGDAVTGAALVIRKSRRTTIPRNQFASPTAMQRLLDLWRGDIFCGGHIKVTWRRKVDKLRARIWRGMLPEAGAGTAFSTLSPTWSHALSSVRDAPE